MTDSLWQRSLRRIAKMGVEPNDGDEVLVWKATFNLGLLAAMAVLTIVGLIYMVFDEKVVGMGYLGFSLLGLLHFGTVGRWPRAFHFSVNLLGVVALVEHQATSLLLGGFVNSGGLVLWGLVFPVTVMLMGYGPRRAALWSVAYAVNVVSSVLVQLHPTTNLPPLMVQCLLAFNILIISGNLLLPLGFFFAQRNLAFRLLRLEQDKAENLLLNILPRDIAAILKNEQRTIADQFDSASILFADMVNFTPLSARMKPVELVELLNDVFSHFDALVESHDLEKIKTIGDCYMVASGVPRPRPDHAHALVRMALELRDLVSQHTFGGRKLTFRIGINSGPVVAGVIGRKKFIYDLWGDAVNTASRMESHGSGGAIQIARGTYELIKDDFICEPRGMVNVKGKGDMEMWLVTGTKELSA